VVGNVGTHGKKAVSRADILDAYRAYEFALEKMFEDKKESIEAIVRRLKRLR
jgi:ribosomal protein S21